jgi:predicted transcriptional regulator
MTKAMPISVRLEPEITQQLAAIATLLDRPTSWVIAQAVKDYVALQSWQLAAIDEGIKAADEGRVVAHDEVVAWVQSWDTPDERPMPKCG